MQMWDSDEYVVVRNNWELPINIRNFVTFRRAPIKKTTFAAFEFDKFSRGSQHAPIFKGLNRCNS